MAVILPVPIISGNELKYLPGDAAGIEAGALPSLKKGAAKNFIQLTINGSTPSRLNFSFAGEALRRKHSRENVSQGLPQAIYAGGITG